MLDTSIIIDGIISNKIDNNEIDDGYEIIIPRLAIDELQSQACKQRDHGFVGLGELRKIRDKCMSRNISVKIAGQKPSLSDIKLAKNGRIDALICDIAEEENATLREAQAALKHKHTNLTSTFTDTEQKVKRNILKNKRSKL